MARALGILRAFTDARPAWSLTALARELGLNKTTAHRLLTALEETGLLIRDEGEERYRLGPEAIALGARAMRANPLRQVARPELESLARETGETATLEILVDLDVLIVDEATTGRLLGGGGEVGVRYPAHTTGTGKVLLASQPDLALPDPLPGRTPATITDASKLREVLDRAEADGYGLNVEELERGFAAVGAPIRDGSGAVVAAIGVGGPVTRMMDGDYEPMIEAVKRAARRISHRLGGDE